MTLLLFLLLGSLNAYATISKSDMDNVRLQVSRGWLADAEQSLTQLLDTPDGAEDTNAWLELSKLRVAMGLIPQAKAAASTASASATTPEARATGLSYASYLESGFGLLRVKAPRAATLGTVQVLPTHVTGGTEMTEYIEQAKQRLTSPKQMPTDIWLPVGSYTVNGEAFAITAGTVQDITVRQKSLYATGSALLHDVFVETGAGVGGWLGTESVQAEPSLTALIGLYTGPIVWRLGVQKTGWIYQPETGQNARDSQTLPSASVGYALWMASVIHTHLTLEMQKTAAPSVREDGSIREQVVTTGGLGLAARSSHRLGSLKLTFGIRTVLMTALEEYTLPSSNTGAMHLSAGAIVAIAN